MEYPSLGYRRSAPFRGSSGYQRALDRQRYGVPANVDEPPAARKSTVPDVRGTVPEWLPKAARAFGAFAARYGPLGRFAGRLNPLINFLWTAYDVYKLWQSYHVDDDPYTWSRFVVPPGFVLWRNCGNPPVRLIKTNYSQASCPNLSLWQAGSEPAAEPVYFSSFRIWYYYKFDHYWNGYNYYKKSMAWKENSPYLPGTPIGMKALPVRRWHPAQDAMAAIDPLSQPVGAPEPDPNLAPKPRALPKRGENPWRSPEEQRQASYDVPPRPGETPRPDVRGRRVVREIGKPNQVTAASPKREPPGPRVKEKKVRSKFARVVGAIVNEVSETTDYIDAVFKALPKKRRPRWMKRPDQRIHQIWTHWDELDWEQVAINLVLNEIEDRSIGYLGKKSKQAREAVAAVLGVDPLVGFQYGSRSFKNARRPWI